MTIIKTCCEYYNVSEKEVFIKNRNRELADIRHMIRKILRVRYSLKDIGRMTNCNHSNVINSIKRADALIQTDKKFSNDYDKVLKYLENRSMSLEKLCKIWGERTDMLKAAGDKFAKPYAEMQDRMIHIYDWARAFGIIDYSDNVSKSEIIKKTLAKTLEFGIRMHDIREFLNFELEKVEY